MIEENINNLEWLLDYEVIQSARHRRFVALVMLSPKKSSEQLLTRILAGMIRHSDTYFSINGYVAVLMGETDRAGALMAVKRYQELVNGAIDVRYSVASFPDDVKETSKIINTAYRRLEAAHTLDSGAVVAEG